MNQIGTSSPQRLQHIDLLRGVAIALMVAFHFSFDLSHFGFIEADFYNDPFWLIARTFILSLFLLLVGISLVLSTRNGLQPRPVLRRLGLIIGCAALISLSSYLMFGPRWIFFGVLHFIALASIIGLLFVSAPRLALALGVILIALGNGISHSFFDQAAVQWIGLMTYKPPTEDYVPLIPWFGVVLIGIFLAHTRVLRTQPPQWLQNSESNPLVRLLARAGCHSLVIYMLHQPILIGVLRLVKLGM